MIFENKKIAQSLHLLCVIEKISLSLSIILILLILLNYKITMLCLCSLHMPVKIHTEKKCCCCGSSAYPPPSHAVEVTMDAMQHTTSKSAKYPTTQFQIIRPTGMSHSYGNNAQCKPLILFFYSFSCIVRNKYTEQSNWDLLFIF